MTRENLTGSFLSVAAKFKMDATHERKEILKIHMFPSDKHEQ